jgi:hypothetical protein
VIIPGTYVVSHIRLYASNLVLNYDRDHSEPSFAKDHLFIKCPKLQIFQQPDSLDVKLSASRYMHLDRNRFLEIELLSGWNEVSSGELHIRAATAGLRVQTSEARVVGGSLELSKKAEAGIVRFGEIKSGLSVKLRMPFNLEHEVNDISLKLEVSYKTDKGDFIFATTPHMSIMLPLGVNVQDVFKHKALFSRFTISSATSSPLRLLSSQLESSELFKTDCGTTLTKPVVIFPRQPASMLYKIMKTSSAISGYRPRSGRDPKANLSLILHYICLEEEIEHTVSKALRNALENTSLYQYIRLVTPIVLNELRTRMTPYDLERTAILNELTSSILSTVRWRDHFIGLGYIREGNQDIPTLLADELHEWQRSNPVISLLPVPTDAATIADSRSIVIPVEVPSISVVHTANLSLGEQSKVSTNTTVVATLHPISASLSIKWTRIWDTEEEYEPKPDQLEFVYEVSGSSDAWLIGGRRKGHFKVPTSSLGQGQSRSLVFPVMLIPLREGYLPYPNVEIRPAPVTRVLQPGSSGGHDTGNQLKQAIVNCESDYKNSGETIRVISDARKTTVSLDASGPQGGAWLLETERRLGESGKVVHG